MSEKQPTPKKLTEAEADFLRWMDEIDLEDHAKPATEQPRPADKRPDQRTTK